MKKHILLAVLALFLVGCASQSMNVAEDKLKSIKTVAVVNFTLKAKIVYRDDPKEDDSDLGAWGANSTAFGFGENAANLAFPEFIAELNQQNLPFKVISYDQMKASPDFMALQPKMADENLTEEAKKAAIAALSTDKAGTGPSGLKHFGLPKKWKAKGSAITGKNEQLEYVKQAIKALGVDAAIIIVDRGASFQCRVACLLGNGDATMGGAFNAALIGSDGSTIMTINNWFDGKAHAVMTGYIVNPLQREKLYKEHGARMAQVFAETYHEHTGT